MGPAGPIETTLRHSPGYARALPGKEIPDRAYGSGHGLAEWRRPVDIQVCQAVHDAQAGRQRTRRSKRLQGLCSVFRFGRLQDRRARVQNAEVDALVGCESALTALDRTPEGPFKTRDIAVERAGQ